MIQLNISTEDRAAIITRCINGEKQREVAAAFNLTRGQVAGILQGDRRKRGVEITHRKRRIKNVLQSRQEQRAALEEQLAVIDELELKDIHAFGQKLLTVTLEQVQHKEVRLLQEKCQYTFFDGI